MLQMPQTVPSPSCEFGDFDAFDLSLLPAPGTFDSHCSGDFCGSDSSNSSHSSRYSPAWGVVGTVGAVGAAGASDCEVPFAPTAPTGTGPSPLMSLFCGASPPPVFSEDAKPARLEARFEVKQEVPEPLLGSCSSWENQPTACLFPFIKQEQDGQQDASVPQLDDSPRGEDMSDLGDHHLLREVLKDTSFQRKFNLKPFDLGGLGGLAQQLGGTSWAAPLRRTLSGGSSGLGQALGQGFGSLAQGAVKLEQGGEADLPQLDQDAIEPMISLAIQQMRNEIGNTCSVLGISPGEYERRHRD